MAAETESFYVGKKFTSWNELQNCKEIYETSNLINLTMRDAKTLGHRHAPIRAARANKELRYFLLRLCCSYGGRKYRKQGYGRRKTDTRKVNCGMFIRLVLSDDGQSLQVVEMNETHSNHEITAEAFLHQPQQRRLDPAHLELAETLISVHANSKLVQHTLHSTSGKVVLLKDIANMRYKLKHQSTPNNVTEVLKQLQRHADCVVKALANEENTFRGIFYQDQCMQEVFRSYPEMLLCDATYKLLDRGFTVYILLAVDGNGQSQIVAVMLLADETTSTISAAIKTFQDHNPEWTKTVSIMTDKDFVNREVFTDLFPNTVLLICLYHTLRTFRQEVTCEKMGITKLQREQCLSILRDLAYAADEDAYRHNMDRLLDLGCEKVSEYLKESWEPIRHEWVEGLRAQHLTLGESANNGLESINAKIKSLCTKDASLQRFFADFRSFISSMRIECRHRALTDFSKKPTIPVPAELVPYSGFLTPFAFQFVMAQYDKSLHAQFTARSEDNFIFEMDESTVFATPASCGCRAYCMKRLPCQHILYVRRWLGLSFDETVLDSRWTRLTYMTYCNSNQTEVAVATASISHVDESAHVQAISKLSLAANSQKSQNLAVASEPVQGVSQLSQAVKSQNLTVVSTPEQGISQLSQAAKYRKSLNLTDNIASLCCEPEMRIFEQRCKVLQQLHDSWSKGLEVLGFLTHNVPDAPKIGCALVVKEAPVTIGTCKGVSTEVQLSPVMRKRGRPKGSETAVTDVAKKRQREDTDSSGLPQPLTDATAKQQIAD